jgi:hypothetical protein
MIGESRSGSMPNRMRGGPRKVSTCGHTDHLGLGTSEVVANPTELEEMRHLHETAELL